jgi:CDP-ribitol ribitolphosphotransferase
VKNKGVSLEKVLSFATYFLAYLLFSIPGIGKMLSKKNKKIVGFAFDYFSGNIKYLYQEMKNYPEIEAYFVTTIKKEAEKLRLSGVNAYYYRDVKRIPLFLKTDVWVTSHGPNFIPFRGIRRIIPFYKGKRHSKWVDVWHGLGFKYADRDKMLIDYDLGFVTSKFFKQFYSRRADVSDKLKITGDARTDPLIKRTWSREEILKEIGIPINRKNIFYAPTWHHGKKRSFLPWGTIDENLEVIERFCQENNCNFFARMHPLWSWVIPEEKEKTQEKTDQSKYVFDLSVERYPDVQRVLYITDVLITDWSSIANDFILLSKPVIFLDIELPVEESVLTPEERVGYVITGKQEFFEKLSEAITKPNLFPQKRKKIIKKLYKYVDGNSSKRCAQEILKLLN